MLWGERWAVCGVPSLQVRAYERILAHQLYKLLLSAASTHIPVTLLRFPLLALNKEYLFGKLRFLIEPAGISFDDFGAAFELISKPDRINFL